MTQSPTPRRRGPKRSLTLDQVVDAALEVVDEGGPTALSIRSVATRLGVLPNALYTYVESRAALERELVERVLAESDIALLATPDRAWRTRILDYALSLRTTMLQHPAVALLIMTAPMDGPAALLVGERLIDAFTEGGLSPEDASRSSYALMVQVLGFLALEVAETEARPPLPAEALRVQGRRAALDFLDDADWPMTAATRDVTAQWITTQQFTWSVERLLDGIAALS
ncbi:MAG TPA: TetR/AcrR family transcriptional regulator C-terminal domain-containing protein [Lapillicoccus sp.]|nr:TetR/AcrR family transcriptional regulator C-terminal domain-containing protein [Lapillicoccus sp.]